MNIELVAQMFKNYQSNVLFHLEGKYFTHKSKICWLILSEQKATENLKDPV